MSLVHFEVAYHLTDNPNETHVIRLLTSDDPASVDGYLRLRYGPGKVVLHYAEREEERVGRERRRLLRLYPDRVRERASPAPPRCPRQISLETPMTKNYVAAWSEARTAQLLKELGVEKEIHLTTFFDRGEELEGMAPAPWEGVKFATISKLNLWYAGRSRHIVAEVEAPWASQIHEHYAAQSRLKHPAFKPHVTLKRDTNWSEVAQFAHLRGMTLVFDRHGRET